MIHLTFDDFDDPNDLRMLLLTAMEHMAFLEALIPGWVRDPIPGMVLPGHTLEYEREASEKFKYVEEWRKEVSLSLMKSMNPPDDFGP